MLEAYPNEPGHRGVDTSVQAADRVGSASSRLRALVYRTLYDHPAGLTVDEVCRMAALPRYSLQPRFSELRQARSIRDTGQRRINVSGAHAIVWAVSVFETQEDAA